MMDINMDLLERFIILGKKTSGRSIKNQNISNKELAEQLHKAAIKKVKRRKVHSPFIDNI